MERPRMVFMHIPKCAGGSLTDWLLKQYRKYEVFNCGHDGTIHDFISMPQNKRDEINLLCGHVYYGIHNQFSSPDEVQYITMLRNPVERTISQYWFMENKGKDFPFYKAIRSMPAEDFIRAGMNPFLHNPMTHMLSCSHRDNKSVKVDMLEAARDTLFKIGMENIGFVDRFDSFLVNLCEMYGFTDQGYERRNVSKKGNTSDEMREAARDVSQLDIALYSYIEISRTPSTWGEIYHDKIFRKTRQNENNRRSYRREQGDG